MAGERQYPHPNDLTPKTMAGERQYHHPNDLTPKTMAGERQYPHPNGIDHNHNLICNCLLRLISLS